MAARGFEAAPARELLSRSQRGRALHERANKNIHTPQNLVLSIHFTPPPEFLRYTNPIQRHISHIALPASRRRSAMLILRQLHGPRAALHAPRPVPLVGGRAPAVADAGHGREARRAALVGQLVLGVCLVIVPGAAAGALAAVPRAAAQDCRLALVGAGEGRGEAVEQRRLEHRQVGGDYARG